jgi:uncharacterized membrane-anchored protein
VSFLPPNHPDRFALANEIHARPPSAMPTPSRVTYSAVIVAANDRALELTHVAALCERFGVPPPEAASAHFSAELGELSIKWEKHTEFSSYTFFRAGASDTPFVDQASDALPIGWMAGIPGQTIVATQALLLASDGEPPTAEYLNTLFTGNQLIGSEVADGQGLLFTDFRVHKDGCGRCVLFNRALVPRHAGRIMQRVFEIEAYRMMALLALPITRQHGPRIATIETALANITSNISLEHGSDESLLHELSVLAVEVESTRASSQMRFGASRAYHELVRSRIAELRESRVAGIQTIDEFMSRRLTPAMATCATVAQRLHDVSERIAQASSLLSTRTDVVREKQNQALLASMDQRAKTQLRLQQAVEGLSIAAIAYYVVGLLSYFFKSVSIVTPAISAEIATGIAVPVVIVLVAWAVRRARKKNADEPQPSFASSSK